MKYPQEQFKKLTEALPVLLNFFGVPNEQAKELTIGQLHEIHFKIYQQKNYSGDNNPNVKFIDGKRLFEIDRDFKLYPEGCNDDNIETAMKTAIKQVYGS